MRCLFQMPGREKSRHKQAAQPRKQTPSIICISTSHTLPPPPPSPPRPWQRCSTATLSLLGGGTGTPGTVLTNAVTQGGPVEAGLAAHDTTVGAQAVLAPPRATDGIPVLFTLIHICREESKERSDEDPACSLQHLGQAQLARCSDPLLVLTSHQQIGVLGAELPSPLHWLHPPPRIPGG